MRQYVMCASWVLAAAGLLGCDEEPKPQPEAEASAVAPAASAAPTASVAEKPAEKKKPKKTLADCPKGNTVKFDDPDLEKAVRFKAQKETGDITTADLAKLTSLNLAQVKVNELDICLFTHMKDLKDLFLGPGKLDDLSPIAGLTKLRSLRASMNQVSDLKPLEGMTEMDRLDLGHTRVRDLKPLSGMTKLTELMLDTTPVEDVAPLAKLENLERLSLKNTRVKDFAPLKKLEKLKFVYVAGTPGDITDLFSLKANGTKIIDQ